ncbi:amidohydrolase [Desulfobacter sp.]|uniref:amidohydrolase family protein n=1 Tax=Desulfobacter sp. TaxID=2294 RepID=UPI000E8CC681|nr:amidohydrolase [Desulfobacter sp.]HBT89617.1 amidohydrolase [Desulfobacter sp.]
MENDILIHNGILLTMEDGLPVIENGFVHIKQGKIANCGPALPEQIRNLAQNPARQIDACGGIIMPGLVNGHTHTPMSMFRGLADDLPLDLWLNAHIFPAEARDINPESVAQWTAHSCREMLAGGITTCCDGYFLENHAAKAMADSGIRAVAGQGVIDFPAPGVPDPVKNIDHAKDFIEKTSTLSPRITPSLFCHSPYTCSKQTLVAGKNLTREKGVLFQIHAAETRAEPGMIKENRGLSVIAYLDSIGILDPDTLLIHCVWLDENDIEIIAKRGCGVIHCPESNMKLASGVAPVPDMIAAGLTVGLGTDGCASNNDQDMFSEMDTAAKLHKVVRLDPCVMDARTCLKMATIEGAKALGLGDITGSIHPGKAADIIVVDTTGLHMTPMHDPYSGLVYAARASDVSWVMVEGKIRLKKNPPLHPLGTDRPARSCRQITR